MTVNLLMVPFEVLGSVGGSVHGYVGGLLRGFAGYFVDF